MKKVDEDLPPTYCDLEDEKGEECEGGGVRGEAGEAERDGHGEEAPPDDQEVGDPSLVEPGGHLGAQHDADHEGGEYQTEG